MMDFKKPDTPKDAYLQYLAGNKDIVLPEPKTDKDLALYIMCVNGVSWNDLTEKPFGETIVTVKEVLAETTLTTPNENGQFFLHEPAKLTVGEQYIVNWNGVDYSCTAIEGVSSLPMLVNDGANLGTGENLVFVIVLSDTAVEDGVYGFVMTSDATATFSIRQETETVTKLSGKCVDGMGWSEPAKYVLPESTVPSAVEWTDLPAFELVDKGEYIVSINGVDHPCTGEYARQSIVQLTVYDENEDELLHVQAWGGGANFRVEQNVLGESFTLSIREAKETIHPIDQKYIVLASPNGTKYNLSVADDGTLSAVAT